MARPRKSTEKLERYSLGLAPSHRKELKRAGLKMGKEDADVFRESSAIGLIFLRLINYQVPSAVVEKAMRILSEKKNESGG